MTAPARPLPALVSWRDLTLRVPGDATPRDPDEVMALLAAHATRETWEGLAAYGAWEHAKARTHAIPSPACIDWTGLAEVVAGEGGRFLAYPNPKDHDTDLYLCPCCVEKLPVGLSPLDVGEFREGEDGFVERIWCAECRSEIYVRNGTGWQGGDESVRWV